MGNTATQRREAKEEDDNEINSADVAQAETISDAHIMKAASEAMGTLTPPVIREIFKEFGVANVADLDQDQRREFLDVINEEIETGGHGEIKNRTDPLAKLPESVSNLIKKYQDLDWDESSGLDGGDEYLFVRKNHDPDFTPPTNIPYIVPDTGDAIYFMIPKDIDLPERLAQGTFPDLAAEFVRDGVAHIPEEDEWPDAATITEAIEKFSAAVDDAKRVCELEELLRKERLSDDFFASAAEIDVETPMLIEGLIRERGVSVFYGAFDEFKTTLVLDMMAHVAAGATWQGRKVTSCPVIWYALEGKEEIPIRLRALETSLKEKDTPWGSDRVPIFARDRIPETPREWRAEIGEIASRSWKYVKARWHSGDLAPDPSDDSMPLYPLFAAETPIIVIDTLSLALGGEDEKGPRAVGFITDCLDLLKERPDLGNPYLETDEDKAVEWDRENAEIVCIEYPVASHVIIIHHQTKTGIDFAGHRAIAANTQGLYRVHRFGKMTDAERPYAGQLTPIRVKGIPRPAPIRFEVDVVPVEGTKQTATILKDKAKAIPKKLKPIIEALRELEDHEEISNGDVNACIDEVAANRNTRSRYRKELEAAGVLEPVGDDNGKVAFYRFHDTGAV